MGSDWHVQMPPFPLDRMAFYNQGGVLEVQVQPALGLTHNTSCLEPKSAEKMGVFFLIPFKVHKGQRQALLARPS